MELWKINRYKKIYVFRLSHPSQSVQHFAAFLLWSIMFQALKAILPYFNASSPKCLLIPLIAKQIRDKFVGNKKLVNGPRYPDLQALKSSWPRLHWYVKQHFPGEGLRQLRCVIIKVNIYLARPQPLLPVIWGTQTDAEPKVHRHEQMIKSFSSQGSTPLLLLQANANVKLDPVNQSLHRAECQREESGVLRFDAQLLLLPATDSLNWGEWRSALACFHHWHAEMIQYKSCVRMSLLLEGANHI